MGGMERIAITDRVTVLVRRTRSAQRAPWPRRVWWRQRLNIIVREHATGPDSVEPGPAHFVGYSAPQAPVFGRPGFTGGKSGLTGVGVTVTVGVGVGVGVTVGVGLGVTVGVGVTVGIGVGVGVGVGVGASHTG